MHKENCQYVILLRYLLQDLENHLGIKSTRFGEDKTNQTGHKTRYHFGNTSRYRGKWRQWTGLVVAIARANRDHN